MVYDDPLSKKSLQHAPNWPPEDWLTEPEGMTDDIEEELKHLDFNIDQWLEYKLHVPNDGKDRVFHHSDVEYTLTKEELAALKDGLTLCNPELCPKAWHEYKKNLGELNTSFWWLAWQGDWVQFGYPPIPRKIWDSNKYFLRIFQCLVYKPFIRKWGSPPDDFWVKLSYLLEAENQEFLHRGFALLFHFEERVFPPPDLYNPREDPDNNSFYLPQKFWD